LIEMRVRSDDGSGMSPAHVGESTNARDDSRNGPLATRLALARTTFVPKGRRGPHQRDWVYVTVEFAGSAALLAVTGGVLHVFDGSTAIETGCALTATGGVLAFLAER
jgi:hypothetical protein